MAGGTKTAVMAREETAAAMGTAAKAAEGTAAAMGTAATTGTAVAVGTAAAVAGAPKVFREGAIIAAGKETATIAARTSRKSSAASFNGREKYIWIRGDVAAFA